MPREPEGCKHLLGVEEIGWLRGDTAGRHFEQHTQRFAAASLFVALRRYADPDGREAFAFWLELVIITPKLKTCRPGSSGQEVTIKAEAENMATTPIGEFIGSDYKGGAAAASEAGAEGSLLARTYRAAAEFARKHYKVALGAAAGVGAMVAAEGGADAGTIVDIDWRLAGDYSNIHYLDDKTTLDPAVSGSLYHVEPLGTVNFEDKTPVPTGYRLWFFDAGNQPIGFINVYSGAYVFGLTSIYGDQVWTDSIDEGASLHDPIKVVAQEISTNTFRSGEIVSGILHDRGFDPDPVLWGDNPENNINIIPEPASIALLGLGVGVAALTRRRRKFQPDMDSDLGKQEVPYYRRFE